MELCIGPEEHNSHLQPYLQMLYLMIIGSFSFFLSFSVVNLILCVFLSVYKNIMLVSVYIFHLILCISKLYAKNVNKVPLQSERENQLY